MKTIIKAATLAVAVTTMTACADQTTAPDFAAKRELIDETILLSAAAMNSSLQGSFVVSVNGTSTTVITSGPANFPGHPPAGPGTCENGKWFNSQGKGTSGSMDNPHPHCIGVTTTSVSVVLEPISVKFYSNGQNGVNDHLEFTASTVDDMVMFNKRGGSNAPGTTTGAGSIEAWAIDASTLGTTNKRVGKITIDLTQYTTDNADLFLESCTLGAVTDRCLNKVITVTYTPWGPTPIGTTQDVTGFLYWAPATTP